MLARCPSTGLLLLGLLAAAPSRAQDSPPLSEVPIERCDLLPIVKVRIDKTDMRFLLDTAATSILNLKSFSSGRSKEIHVTSWTGTAATSAREVSLPELIFGTHHLRGLKLPAIDLSPIGNACGGQIDGILGVDLLDKMGVTIDLQRRIASLPPQPSQTPSAQQLYEQMQAAMHHCEAAFESGKSSELEECFDPEIVFYTPQGEFRGRKQVMVYLQNRYLRFAPRLHYRMCVHDIRTLGDALWYSYDYEIDSPEEHIAGHGMSVCRKDQNTGRWRILNLHNSFRDTPAHAAPAPSD